MKIRINKFIAQNSQYSRRQVDELIERGKILINGKKAGLGDTVSDADSIKVKGQELQKQTHPVYIALNKPVGYITTTDTSKPDNVLSLIDVPERVFPVGRLDVATCGLLLLTNNGELANTLMHPKFEHEKEYLVEVARPLRKKDEKFLTSGVPLKEGKTLPVKIRSLGPNRFLITLKEGRTRQIRRMIEAIGNEVVSLKRIRVASVKLNNLAPGKWRHLTEKEVQALKQKTAT